MKEKINIEFLSSEKYIDYLHNLGARLDCFSSMAYKIEDIVAEEIEDPTEDGDVKFIIAFTPSHETLIIRLSDKTFFTYSGNNAIINEWLFLKGFRAIHAN